VKLLVFGRGEHPEGAVAASGVVEQFDVVADRAGELDAGLPAVAVEELLDLMTVDLRGQADGRDWADRLRERLYLAGGAHKTSDPATIPKGSTRCSPERKKLSIRIE
jgi:hypothetical protein